jgi:hypothetical protein
MDSKVLAWARRPPNADDRGPGRAPADPSSQRRNAKGRENAPSRPSPTAWCPTRRRVITVGVASLQWAEFSAQRRGPARRREVVRCGPEPAPRCKSGLVPSEASPVSPRPSVFSPMLSERIASARLREPGRPPERALRDRQGRLPSPASSLSAPHPRLRSARAWWRLALARGSDRSVADVEPCLAPTARASARATTSTSDPTRRSWTAGTPWRASS